MTDILIIMDWTQILVISFVMFLYLNIRPWIDLHCKRKNVKALFLLTDTFFTLVLYSYFRDSIVDRAIMDWKGEWLLILLFLCAMFCLSQLSLLLRRWIAETKNSFHF